MRIGSLADVDGRMRLFDLERAEVRTAIADDPGSDVMALFTSAVAADH